MDALLRESEEARRLIREVHPEICFWALAGNVAMERSKKSVGASGSHRGAGGDLPAAGRLVREAGDAAPRSRVAPGDVTDALVAALTARSPDLATLPEQPERDSTKLPMEIVYPVLDGQHVSWSP